MLHGGGRVPSQQYLHVLSRCLLYFFSTAWVERPIRLSILWYLTGFGLAETLLLTIIDDYTYIQELWRVTRLS